MQRRSHMWIWCRNAVSLLWAKAHLKLAEAKWKLFCEQTNRNLKLIMENATCSWLKRSLLSALRLHLQWYGGASVESAGSISEKATSILKCNTTFRAHMVSCFRDGLPNFSKTMLNCAQDLLQKHGSVVEAKLVYLCSRPLSNWKHESEIYNKEVSQEVKNENWSPQFPHMVLSQLSLDVLHQTILQKLFSGHYFLVPLRRI